MDYQKLLLEHLELVDRVVRHISRRHHLSAADSEEFSSIVRFRLIDRDFAVLRKFQGRSNLGTYLTAVIERLYLDFCAARWGKWRSSALAERLGPVAVMLEQLVRRDGLTVDQAVETLKTNHGVSETREELHRMMEQLPERSVRKLASEEELALVVGRAGVIDRALDHDDDLQIAERVEAVLSAVVGALSSRQQLILKLRYQDGLSVAKIARLLHVDAKPVHRHLEEAIGLFRDKLRQEGIDGKDIDRIVGHPSITLGRLFEDAPEILGDRNDTSV